MVPELNYFMGLFAWIKKKSTPVPFTIKSIRRAGIKRIKRVLNESASDFFLDFFISPTPRDNYLMPAPLVPRC